MVSNHNVNMVDNTSTSLELNDNRVVNADLSSTINLNNQFDFVDVKQDNSQTKMVSDNDISFVDARTTNLDVSDDRVINADLSSTINLNNQFDQIDQDNSQVNFVENHDLTIINIDQPSTYIDNSRVLTMNILAPEQAGGSIWSGNA